MTGRLTVEDFRVLARKGRVELVRALRAYPEGEFTINELAKVAAVPTMTAWRSVGDLRKIGLVRTRRLGNATIVSLTEERERLRILSILPEADPQRTAAHMFADEIAGREWSEECRLFGTVARGEHLPGDEVDVAVVFDGDRETKENVEKEAADVASRVRERTNVAIIPLCIEKKEMKRRGGLAGELRDKEVLRRRPQQMDH